MASAQDGSIDPWLLPPASEDVVMLVGSIDCGVMILDAERRRVVAIHGALAPWIPAMTPGALADLNPLDWIDPESRGAFSNLGVPACDTRSEKIRLTAVGCPWFEVRGRYSVNSDGDGRWIYWFTPVRDSSEIELAQNEVIRDQKHRAQEAVRTSLQIYQVTEKIRRAPRLSAILLGVREEAELYARVGTFLLSEAVHAQSVRILNVVGEGTLRCEYSSQGVDDVGEAARCEFTLDEILAAQARGECEAATRWVPIELRGEAIGLLEICLDPREQALLDQTPLFRRWLEETIGTLAEMVALFLENIRLYRQLEGQARRDMLTGLHNRRHLLELIDREVARSHREQSSLSVIFIDLDQFKELNDGFGHIVGDRVLSEFARLLEESFRETDDICRYGGDEFVVIMPSTGVAEARSKAQRLLTEIRNHDFASESSKEPITVTLSIGVAGLDPQEEGQDVLRRADEALYVSKRNGRDQISVAPSVHDRQATR